MILIHTIQECIAIDEEGIPLKDTGEFLTENEPIGFRDLVWMMTSEGYREPSCYPPRGSTFEWLSTNPETDYQTGQSEYRTMHYSMKNPSRNDKYWRKAMIVAGIIKNRGDA